MTAPILQAGGRKLLWRYTLITHRWLGIAVGLVVFAWCVSGIVMMYMPYPALEPVEQLAGLEPLDSAPCCSQPVPESIAYRPVSAYALERLLGRTLLRSESGAIDLQANQPVAGWTDDELATAGRNYAEHRGWAVPSRRFRIERDQWTVQAQFNAHRPMLKFANDDGQEWYLSGLTGQVVQLTDRRERFWNWLGAVPHWLYPTVLRQHTALWAQTVIWLTLVSLFLTVTGLIIGLQQYRWRNAGRRSPYRGWMLWHHYAGIVFGLFTFTWVLSGLFSMNPWGLLESRSFDYERLTLNGVNESVGSAITRLDGALHHAPPGTVRIESAYWLNEPFWLARDRQGNATRIGRNGPVSALRAKSVLDAAAALGHADADIARIDTEDAYYFAHHHKVALPAWRIVTRDGERLYIDATTGAFVAGFDANGQWLRWLFEGLHRGDFAAWLRTRPLWDVLMLLLLTGVTVSAGSGVWIGVRRLRGRSSAR